ncbi:MULTISPECIES: HD domain-containing protein [unclassified Paenibacillus]|uniref:HD domain-containing protein n=1 Tax=unclassified Paenibacillus TaxID=185978 RepID=UPI00240698F6|nr:MULTISPECIES: HD domain-containing protein [unclassified Paenibacillus]MDF9844694.1 HD superfamily phosphohydrolase [Paenibacillus sp. PastF-2]MDF9851245.1 HD superfamily phosphohydrolase [Paenibacillus sp. PastM-2]MDF9857828.1 HD superfamily phosphohydrolase [Paenibacillus sp. PastF-1]MDH6483145.1 HD superfamily phosphohydrolase [Paenibacillus sp. PastH-2]MDH6510506.1 HD superfamily phosphohydrolase [Paenibacillus sp. PastM-3]
MNQLLSEEKVFKDPVHNYVHVQETIIWRLINTREFQRLRRIRQLGTSYLTFHGAEHSRFSHSLGVYEITRRIISQFERSGYKDWMPEESLLTLCAALLHDLGHGPFSHSIEEAFEMNHEDWTCRIILEDTEITAILKDVAEDFPQKVASVISKTYEHEIVVNLVSGPLDADRMDYLLRDAYYTGVNYGTIDIDRILRMLRPYHGRVVVKESGMHAIEDYLMSRYQMYWQVYFHPVTRSSEIILRQIFRRAKELFQNGYAFGFMIEPLKDLFRGEVTVEQYLLLDEAMIQTAFMQWTLEQDELLSDLCCRFIHRKLYKYVEIENLDSETIGEIRRSFAGAGLNAEYDLEIDFPTDLPYDVFRPGDAFDSKQILLLDRHDKLREISEVSDIVRSISGIHRGRYHLYFPQDKLHKALPLLPSSIAEIFEK